jgi:hypothetical protein
MGLLFDGGPTDAYWDDWKQQAQRRCREDRRRASAAAPLSAAEHLCQQLRELEQLRDEVEALIEYPHLAPIWKSFQAAGGVTAADLEQHIKGKTIRRRTVRTKEHMRLVVDNAPRPRGGLKRLRPRRPLIDDPGPEAA